MHGTIDRLISKRGSLEWQGRAVANCLSQVGEAGTGFLTHDASLYRRALALADRKLAPDKCRKPEGKLQPDNMVVLSAGAHGCEHVMHEPLTVTKLRWPSHKGPCLAAGRCREPGGELRPGGEAALNVGAHGGERLVLCIAGGDPAQAAPAAAGGATRAQPAPPAPIPRRRSWVWQAAAAEGMHTPEPGAAPQSLGWSCPLAFAGLGPRGGARRRDGGAAPSALPAAGERCTVELAGASGRALRCVLAAVALAPVRRATSCPSGLSAIAQHSMGQGG